MIHNSPMRASKIMVISTAKLSGYYEDLIRLLNNTEVPVSAYALGALVVMTGITLMIGISNNRGIGKPVNGWVCFATSATSLLFCLVGGMTSIQIILAYVIVLLSLVRVEIDNKFLIGMVSLITTVYMTCVLCVSQDTAYGIVANMGTEYSKKITIIVLNLAIIGLIVGATYVISGDLRVTGYIVILGYTLLILVESMVVQTRGTSLQINDFLLLDVALSVAGKYTFNFTPQLMTALLLNMSAFILTTQTLDLKLNVKEKVVIRIIPLTIFMGAIWILAPYSNPDKLIKKSITPISFYETNNGLALNLYSGLVFSKMVETTNYAEAEEKLVRFNESGEIDLTDNNTSQLSFYDPLNYGYTDTDKAHISLDFLDTESAKTRAKPDNVVIVMAESMCEFEGLVDYTFSGDYLSGLHSLYDTPNTIKGQVYTPTYGGGTANTEFEVLTGSSTDAFDSDFYAYQTFIKDDYSSIVTDYNKSGYDTVALHTYKRGGYNRPNVYKFMGFDEQYFDNDEYFRDCKKTREYIADSVGFDFIEDNVISRDNPTFTYYITMGGHGGFDQGFTDGEKENMDKPGGLESFESTSNEVKPDPSMDYSSTYEEYMTVQREFDKALLDFLDHMKSSTEKTLVVVFGDHRMGWGNGEMVNNLIGRATPLVIWANYDIPEIPANENLVMSTNYLGAIVTKLSNIPMTPKNQLLTELYKEMPIISRVGCVNSKLQCFKTYEDLSDTSSVDLIRAITYDCAHNSPLEMYWKPVPITK